MFWWAIHINTKLERFSVQREIHCHSLYTPSVRNGKSKGGREAGGEGGRRGAERGGEGGGKKRGRGNIETHSTWHYPWNLQHD